MAGETQSSTDVIAAGNRSLVLQTELADKTCKDKPFHTVFKVQNLNGQPVEVTGTFNLYKAQDADFKKLDEKPVATGTFTSNEEMTIHWGNLPSGPYVLKATVKDTQGKEVTADANTILFSSKDQRPPIETTVWFYEANTEFDAEHPAMFCFGTSKKEAYVMMNVFSGNELLESKVMNLSDTIVHFKYPYKESYGEGVFLNFCMVRDGQVYQEQVRLKKRLPDKTLTMKWEVFRDKLRPGQKEEWKLTIKTPQGQAAEAEMLATMYDASLDKIWNRKQNFSIYYNQLIPYSNWMSGYFGNNSFNYWWNQKYLKVPAMEYDHFVTQLSIEHFLSAQLGGVPVIVSDAMDQASSRTIRIRGTNTYAAKGKVEMVGAVASNAAMEVAMDAAGNIEEETLPEAPADLRTNLAETAFFYPQLRTNEQGEVSFSFTMPESLTRWNFRGYSHTKGMLTGTLDGEATTSKEFMLTPNLPRFVRVGDKTSIAASISNMTGKLQVGTVSMILFDPMTEKVISTQKQKFTVEAGKTIGVNFMFSVSDKYEILGCRMDKRNDN